MSRARSRYNSEVCGDCGALEPSWASINKGILLCIECCSIHRSLGNHISQVKSLQKSNWSNSQRSMLYTLNNSGVNSIWEHALEHNSKFSRKKPSPKDNLHVKAEFIRAKHQQCAFAYRPNNEDGLLCVENELGKQLHASVRSTNLETSFRLIVHGADPNYFHDEKGSTPLHAAVKAGQLLQTELLLTYGADPTCPDSSGKTPVDYAKQMVNRELYNRLLDCQYEVTDKFSDYLCHRRPNHEKGIHFLIPQAGTKSDATALYKLKKLPNHLFEELVMDVYDEVDRRETEAIWLSSADTLELNANAVPFLPVNPTLSTVRNQGRQKLGRFTTPELKNLIHDILVDTQRRQLNSEKVRQFSQISDDEPLYDSVASDDDYALLTATNHVASDQHRSTSESKVNKSTETSGISDKESMELLIRRLHESDNTIADLKYEIGNLRKVVERLSNENNELRTKLSEAETNISKNDTKINGETEMYSLDGFLMINAENNNNLVNGTTTIVDLKQSKRVQRPNSMYETREGPRQPNWQTLKNHAKQNENNRAVTQFLYSGQNVMQCTEQVTKGIQELWKCIQGLERNDCLIYAEKIKAAVENLAAAIPLESANEVVQRLQVGAARLKTECTELVTNDSVQIVDHCLQKIRLCAYEIAKDTKILVTKYTAH
ncbi:ARF GTPase-activating protein GIT2 [Agrilus planipennis]|uniref:ARF GTPase-activating protein GIT2 n=1 Tax=Agrilus planipennis TaxID=224129 RepID=A0A1W4X0D2_AGRPL|nr:ARF GTPase-activating protein GIT2 [Agrilus planipennis]